MKKLKKTWNEFLKRLEKENKELFQGNKPDCCNLNNQKKGVTR
jgi:hypothetical protein